jgi:predicted RNA-binding Zn-ribbon protein involved in translation (DUF1610 family)
MDGLENKMRMDYSKYNWCATCNIKMPKSVIMCPDCGYHMRRTPRNYILVTEDKKRY